MSNKKPTNQDWSKLQRKIFTRWVNQKVAKKNITVNDVVTGMQDGLLLINLLEVVSEKNYTGKLEKNPKLKPHKIDNLNNALKFTFDTCQVELKNKPSAEQLYDGDETAILGLIWAIMLKFMKIGDDEGDQLNAKDALLMWAQNKTQGYKDVKIEKFGKEWHDGLALCAIIHKHRPKLIPWETLSKDHPKENLQLAMDAAYKYFNLEKYLTVDDIPKLDESSMFVYVSEYYYGIAEQRKLDLAAKRISKVIKLTVENDAMKKEYNETSQKFKELVSRVEKILEDRTIDNTMAGAKKKLEEFYEYKTKDKNVILGHQLDLQALYNNLAMRLSHHKRPEFIPPAGLSLKDIDKVVAHLEECEQERKVALHKELNRQIKLVKLDEQHKSRHSKLISWSKEKESYLKTKELIESVSVAELQLRLLDAFDREYKNMNETGVVELNSFSKELISEKYERSNDVLNRDEEIKKYFELLKKLSEEKRPVLDDALAREKFKEKVRMMNQQHIDTFEQINSWFNEKEKYLNTRETINSVSEARTQLSLFESYEKEKKFETETNVAELKQLGSETLSSKYETKYSSWSIENPEKIHERESNIDNNWKKLDELAQEKKRILDDHLQREEFAEKVRMMNQQHIDTFEQINSWVNEKEKYLNTRETINSVSEARTQLSLFESYEKEKKFVTQTNVAELKQLGSEILSSKYETKYSSWSIENPEKIHERESNIDNNWKKLDELAQEKKRILDDHLQREEFAEKVRMMNRNHVDRHDKLMLWINDKESYLQKKETITNVAEARKALSVLEHYEKEKSRLTNRHVSQFKQLGSEILAQKYETKYSKYVFENPNEVKSRETNIESKWNLLSQLSEKKKNILNEDLARELEKERLRMEFARLATEFVRWTKDLTDMIAVSHFGFTLEEVEAYQQKLQHDNDEINNLLKSKKSEYENIYKKMNDLGVKENVYTNLTPKDLENQTNLLLESISKRNESYQVELKRQRDNDALCKQFASVADPFVKYFIDQKDIITQSKLELDEQLKYVNEKISSLSKDSEKLKPIKDYFEKMEAAGITNNRYTTLTAKDVEVQWEQYQSFLKKKQKMLEEEIEHHKNRGVTPEQFKEIESNFKQYDTNNQNKMDKKGLKACLYSLGEEKSRAEVDNIIKQYGDSSGFISYEKFKELMINTLGVSDTKEDILYSFALINKSPEGEFVAKLDKMELVLNESDIEYIKQTAPKVSGGYDYKSWTEDVFSR